MLEWDLHAGHWKNASNVCSLFGICCFSILLVMRFLTQQELVNSLLQIFTFVFKLDGFYSGTESSEMRLGHKRNNILYLDFLFWLNMDIDGWARPVSWSKMWFAIKNYVVKFTNSLWSSLFQHSGRAVATIVDVCIQVLPGPKQCPLIGWQIQFSQNMMWITTSPCSLFNGHVHQCTPIVPFSTKLVGMVLSILRCYERALAWAPTSTTGFAAGLPEPVVFNCGIQWAFWVVCSKVGPLGGCFGFALTHDVQRVLVYHSGTAQHTNPIVALF